MFETSLNFRIYVPDFYPASIIINNIIPS